MINKALRDIKLLTNHEFVAKLIQEYEHGMQGCVKNVLVIDEIYPDMVSVAKDVQILLSEMEKRFG